MAPRRLLLQVEICLMVIVGAAPSRVLAQGGQSGSIVGSVFDSGGTPLRGVKVSASSETHIGGARVSYSNEQGFFRLPALEPGVFQLRASAPRLKSVVVKDVRVGISAPMEVNLVMEVESATEEVAVVERAPLISTTRANVREVFDLDMVEGLPHGSRDNVHSQVVNDVAGGMNGRIRGGATNLLDLLLHGGLRHDCHTGIDLDGALHGFDVVELHDRIDLELVLAEDEVDRLARRDVGVEADELVTGERLDIDLAGLGEDVLRVRYEHEAVIAERHDFDLARLDREGHEAEVHGVVKDVLVNEVRAAVFDAAVDRREGL
jgi:hypothetical protein